MKNEIAKPIVLTQKELDKKIVAHKKWLSSSNILGLIGTKLDLSVNAVCYYGESLFFKNEIPYKNVCFSGNAFTKSTLNRCILSGAQFKNCDLGYSTFTDSQLQGANLRNAILFGANLTNANLTDSNITAANLTNAILSYANLTNAILSYTNLTYANLKYASLTYANLTGANLTGSNLAGANMTYAILSDANLTGANLTHGNLTDSDLSGALLMKTKGISFLQLALANFQKILVDAQTLINLGIDVTLDSTFFALSKDENNDFLLSPLTRTEANDMFNLSKNENLKSLLLTYDPKPPEFSKNPVFLLGKKQKTSTTTETTLTIDDVNVTIRPQAKEFTLTKPDTYFKFK